MQPTKTTEKTIGLVLACEHASKRVPPRYRALFQGHGRILDSHRGWDPGAFELARELARALDAPLFRGVVTRLLVDLNRSLPSSTLFSEFSLELPERERLALLSRYWEPYRSAVRRCVEKSLAGKPRALHLSVHSFTPRLRGDVRRTDVGVLFDPAFHEEAGFARTLSAALRRELPDLAIDLNQPYSGTTDGLTTTLRQALPKGRYIGIELEVNQRFARGEPRRWTRIRRGILRSVESAWSLLEDNSS